MTSSSLKSLPSSMPLMPLTAACAANVRPVFKVSGPGGFRLRFSGNHTDFLLVAQSIALVVPEIVPSLAVSLCTKYSFAVRSFI